MIHPVVYVAGPYRAHTAWAIERNVRAAEELGFQVFLLGAMPLIPHANTRFFHGLGSEEFWVDGTLELLRRSDAVIMLSGWERSKGAAGERAEALRLGMPLFYSVAELGEWLRQGG